MNTELNDRQEIWRGLLYGQRSMMLRLSVELKRDFGLNSAQFEALLYLWEAKANRLPATQLSNQLLYSSGSGSHLISRLEQLHLVRRDRDSQDARMVVVTLTEAGLDLISRARAAHIESLAKEFDPLIGDAEVQVLLDFARRLSRHESVASQPYSG
ncbi:MarR family winged helix-turn-helix transcriptional regulator [Glutamicibacter sp. Je.9.36]|uniref:MarR family winged helix-turn-helix transcriptional regulator n=1 Tax=Glutamicibacter sp. Je.9.36 TaxID=3142837 RepID=UPI003DA9A4D9